MEVKDGQDATLQVITVGDTGSALYNCADITFKADGKGLDANVKNTTGITVDEVVSASQTAGANASSTAGGAAAATSSKAAGEKLVYNGMALIAAAAAVVAVV